MEHVHQIIHVRPLQMRTARTGTKKKGLGKTERRVQRMTLHQCWSTILAWVPAKKASARTGSIILCPEHIPWSAWSLLKNCLGNMLDHEFLMMIIANDGRILANLRRTRYKKLPGMSGSKVPTFCRTLRVAQCLNKAGYKSKNKTALARGYNGQIADYAMCLCTCAWPCVRSNIGL